MVANSLLIRMTTGTDSSSFLTAARVLHACVHYTVYTYILSGLCCKASHVNCDSRMKWRNKQYDVPISPQDTLRQRIVLGIL
jgi:cytosine/uracil/thiamine/allantoin permease